MDTNTPTLGRILLRLLFAPLLGLALVVTLPFLGWGCLIHAALTRAPKRALSRPAGAGDHHI